MHYGDLQEFLQKGSVALAKGPIAMIFAEDLIEVESTITHHQKFGFAQILLFAPDVLELPEAIEAEIHRIDYNCTQTDHVVAAVNTIIGVAPNIWLYYCYNSEYLHYPFCETRSIGELLAFHTEERRASLMTYVIDLYADDLTKNPNGVSRADAHLDKSGYYALGHKGENGDPLERQLDFFGAVHWRFEEHIDKDRRKINRVSIFRAKPGLKLSSEHRFNDEEYNTYSCPWHNNITIALPSFRAAKALASNPGSRHDIQSFCWLHSVKFQWNSQQLLDLGLMETGQWF